MVLLQFVNDLIFMVSVGLFVYVEDRDADVDADQFSTLHVFG
jgi:hypothetical protein